MMLFVGLEDIESAIEETRQSNPDEKRIMQIAIEMCMDKFLAFVAIPLCFIVCDPPWWLFFQILLGDDWESQEFSNLADRSFGMLPTKNVSDVPAEDLEQALDCYTR
jgi:hypothetical protein